RHSPLNAALGKISLGSSMTILKLTLNSLLLISIAACSPFEAFQDMDNKEKQFNELSVKRLGAKAETSWNIHNGELTGITVIYQDGSLNNVTVSKLESEVKSMIKTVYGDESYAISVAISLGAE
ncbi:hypothetical protein M2H29_22345, partial [Vibrio vulnificus]|nr:hypothetical protein [Vibrio vulnificus]